MARPSSLTGPCDFTGWVNSPISPVQRRMSKLAADEAKALFVGGLMALGPRWVDEPSTVERAEHTLLQLTYAKASGAPVPDSLATDDRRRASAFIAAGETLAKTVSSGAGLAPNVGTVSEDDMDFLSVAPTLLQRRIASVADLRLVIVGSDALAWQRDRNDIDPADWRATDPMGAGSYPVSVSQRTFAAAVSIQGRLGLTTSVQDWAIDRDGVTWFLEVNPVGSWAFLPDAERTVPPLLAGQLSRPAGWSCRERLDKPAAQVARRPCTSGRHRRTLADALARCGVGPDPERRRPG